MNHHLIERNRHESVKMIVGLIMSAIIPLVIIFISMRVWEMDFTVPIEFGGDGMLGNLLIKSIQERGIKGYYFCNLLGAPDRSSLIDVPFLDLNYVLEVLILRHFIDSSSGILYAIYFLTYPLAGVTMYLLLNRLSKKYILNVGFSTAYAITPYHFYRAMSHLTLSNYYVVPLAIYLALMILEEDYRGIVPERYRKKGSRWKMGVMLLACIILGFGNVYYAFFGLMCMGVALIVKWIRTERWTVWYREACPIYLTLATVSASLLPKIIFTLQNGVNHVASIRYAFEQEVHGLKIIQLLLPCTYNRISLLAFLNRLYTSRGVNVAENQMASMGLFATFGFLIACLWLVFRMAKNTGHKNLTYANRMNLFSLQILVLILFASVGGFGAFMNYFITPMIRAQNRCSILIVCLALCVFCIAICQWMDTIKKKGYKIASWILLGVLGIFVLYSEVPANVPSWKNANKEQDRIYRDYFARVQEAVKTSEQETPMIYELPFMNFPESGSIINIEDYMPALGYIYTENIRWSYGGVKGRDMTAESLYVDRGASEAFVNGIKDAGFDGIYIDVRGYEDGGEMVNRFYQETMGYSPIVSEDGQLYFYMIN